MLPKSEYLGPGLKGSTPANRRFSVRTLDIEPHYRAKKAEWGQGMDSISLHIHGSKTDWLNCGKVRTHGKLPDDHPDKDLCLVRNFENLFSSAPERFLEETHKTFARRVNGSLVSDMQATKMIRMAVRLNGLNPDQYALRSRRCGGATALYRATGDLDLVARFGRWKGNSIHEYLWKSNLMPPRDSGPYGGTGRTNRSLCGGRFKHTRE